MLRHPIWHCCFQPRAGRGANIKALPLWVPASTRLIHWSPAPQRTRTRRVEAEFEAAPAGAASSAPPPPPAAPAAASAPAGVAAGAPACADADAADAASSGALGGAAAAGAAAAGAPGLLLLVPLMLGLHGKVRRRGARRRTCTQALCIMRPCDEERSCTGAWHGASASFSPHSSTKVESALPPAAHRL